MGPSTNVFAMKNREEYFDFSFISMNEASTEKEEFPARKCGRDDFRGLEALWLEYEDRQVHLICPNVDTDVILFADKSSRKLRSYSLRITKCSKRCAPDID